MANSSVPFHAVPSTLADKLLNDLSSIPPLPALPEMRHETPTYERYIFHTWWERIDRPAAPLSSL